MSAMELTDVRFRYSASTTDVLRVPHFRVERGERLFMFGPSGSGKTTLLSLIGGLFHPNAGKISVLGQDITAMNDSARDGFRAAHVGFIFQVFNLVPYLSILQNVILPCKFGRGVSMGFSSAESEAGYLLGQLGISDVANKNVGNLSIGQQQRVAAARALMGSPGLIVADEPTSALDADARNDFLRVLFEQAKREGSTVIFVSHDRSLAAQFDRCVALADINQVVLRGGL